MPPTIAHHDRRPMPLRLIWEGALQANSARDLSQFAGLVPGQTAGTPKRFLDPRTAGPGYDLIDGVAVIPVYGEIYRHATYINDMMAYYWGMTSIDLVSDALRAAVADPKAVSILLTFDSPGGDVAGVGELAAMIRAAGDVKPVAAYCEYLCCSAAYWLASAAGEITAAPTAIIGSVGVRAELIDDTDYWEQAGVHFTDVVADQSPDKVPDHTTDEGLALYQQLMTATCRVFIADVAANRGVSVETVLSDFGKGWVMLADAAVKAKMVDKVGTLDSTLRKMAGPNRARLAIKRTAASAGSLPSADLISSPPLRMRLRLRRA